jgi:hypothetical protein
MKPLTTPRISDLSDAEDRRPLLQAAEGQSSLAQLIADHLDDYLRLFPEPFWRIIYPGGIIACRGQEAQADQQLN